MFHKAFFLLFLFCFFPFFQYATTAQTHYIVAVVQGCIKDVLFTFTYFKNFGVGGISDDEHSILSLLNWNVNVISIGKLAIRCPLRTCLQLDLDMVQSSPMCVITVSYILKQNRIGHSDN